MKAEPTLKEWIKAEGLSDRQVAKRAKIPVSSLSRFLLGQSSLSAENMRRLSNFTGGKVTIDSLVEQGGKVLRAKHRERDSNDGEGATT